MVGIYDEDKKALSGRDSERKIEFLTWNQTEN